MADAFPAFTPVTLLTGFLGSGKTTLLRRLLADPALCNAAVLINEFGEVGLDHHLLERIDEDMVLLQSGCLCCTVRGELVDAIRDLHSKRERGIVPPFDRIIIESTGLADPFPVLSTLKADPVLRHHFRSSGVIATVDTVNAGTQLAAYREPMRQVAVADLLVLTKADIAEAGQVARITAMIRQINPDAPIVLASDDVISLLEDTTTCRAEAMQSPGGFYCDDPGPVLAGEHSGRIRSFVLVSEGTIDWTAFGIWLTMLLNRHGDRILRVKGILNIEGEDFPVAIHGVQHLVHTPVHMQSWPGGDRRSRIVFIVDGIEPAAIERSFDAFNRLGVTQVAPRRIEEMQP
ncbi:CobW family GTP-binding protein (plasmid) [Rhizobium leguminosarum]|jgi:G3E family GTPase|uniref:Cobalamin biosynthesis protein CobW n=1 Tax=Rhizobium leguminosarum bv. trifolii TaxID=386 RepID=A0A1B8RJ27_RHILT|nr:GTP-binding protein [Rhizobium leguminosarum]AOO88296.1 cobalamin biosynthesis protein CobW [Rhizobium leguminosarum bv. trifolii]OBY08869.1 cobalamin biosynthesis protein CobW [Rhizobium leguminosarum bv. trifolii]